MTTQEKERKVAESKTKEAKNGTFLDSLDTLHPRN
jgi:hypothetical protein